MSPRLGAGRLLGAGVGSSEHEAGARASPAVLAERFPLTQGGVVTTALVLEPTSTGASPGIADGTDVITADHLSKRFGRVDAVDDLSFRLEAGDDHRFPWPERVGENDDVADAARARKADEREARSCSGSSYERPRESGACGWVRCSRRPTSTRAEPAAITCGCSPTPRAAGARADEVLAAGRAPRPRSVASAATRWVCGSGSASRPRCWATPSCSILDEPANGLDPEGVRWLREFLRALAAEGRDGLRLQPRAGRGRPDRRRRRDHQQRQARDRLLARRPARPHDERHARRRTRSRTVTRAATRARARNAR